MIARKYNKRIELWQTTTVPDGYGGNTVTTDLVAALIVTIAALSYTAYKTDKALKKVDQIQIDVEKLKTNNKASIDNINSNVNKTEKTSQKVDSINSDLQKLKNDMQPSQKNNDPKTPLKKH